MVEQIEHIPPELDVRTSAHFYSFRHRCIEIHVPRAVEDATASVAICVRRLCDEVGRVEPEVDRGVVKFAGSDLIGATRGAVVDAGLERTETLHASYRHPRGL